MNNCSQHWVLFVTYIKRLIDDADMCWYRLAACCLSQVIIRMPRGLLTAQKTSSQRWLSISLLSVSQHLIFQYAYKMNQIPCNPFISPMSAIPGPLKLYWSRDAEDSLLTWQVGRIVSTSADQFRLEMKSTLVMVESRGGMHAGVLPTCVCVILYSHVSCGPMCWND